MHQLSKPFYFQQVFLLQISRWLSLWVELDFSQLPPITRQRDQNSQMINQKYFSHKTECNFALNSQCSHSSQDDEITTDEGNHSFTIFSYREISRQVRDFHDLCSVWNNNSTWILWLFIRSRNYVQKPQNSNKTMEINHYKNLDDLIRKLY